MPDLTAYADLFAAYRAAVQSCGGADYPARARVYAAIGLDGAGRMAGAIKAALDAIEQEVTGRTDTGDDWRKQ